MSIPATGIPALPELRGATPIERARFVARQRAAGLKWEQIGILLGTSGQRAGQMLKRYGHDPEIQGLKDVGSAIRLHRKGIAALAELVDLGLSVAREAAQDPEAEHKEKASIVAAAVQPAYRLVEGSEKFLKRHQIGAMEQVRNQFDKDALLDAIAYSIQRIEQLPLEAQEAAKQALSASIHGKQPERPVVDIEALCAGTATEEGGPGTSPF
jgi:hypothetical protein